MEILKCVRDLFFPCEKRIQAVLDCHDQEVRETCAVIREFNPERTIQNEAPAFPLRLLKR